MYSSKNAALSRYYHRIPLSVAALAIALSPLPTFAASGAPDNAPARKGAAAYLLDQCPTQSERPNETALAAIAASFAADFIIGAVEKWLAKRKAELSGEFVAATSTPRLFSPPVEGAAPQLSFGCVVIASGEFGELRPKASARGDLTVGKLSSLGLADQPNFYFEAVATAVGPTVTLQPTYIDYRALAAAKRSSKGVKKVVAIVGFSGKSLAKDAKVNDENSFAVYRFNFGELEVGKIYKGEKIFTGTSAVQEMPAPIVNGAFAPRPANVFAFVGETEEPSLALELMTSSFNSNKDSINKAIEDAIKKALGETEEKQN